MKKKMKSIGSLFVMLTCICGCGASNLTTPADSGAGSVSVTVNTTVRKTGQYPESFEVTYGNKINEKSLDPASFKLTGKAGYWGSDDTRDFECSFSRNSFGGAATLEFSEKYPETVSAAMALCPALTYCPEASSGFEKMKNVPVWFAHATGDNTIPVSASRNAVAALEKLGAREIRFTEYTDEQMNASGADGAPDATYSYHHVELAVMEDDTYQEWLFNH